MRHLKRPKKKKKKVLAILVPLPFHLNFRNSSSHHGSAVTAQLESMRTQIQFLALLGGLRIWHSCELWYRSQMQLRSCIAVAVVWVSSCSSDSVPSLGTSMSWVQPLKKKKRKLRHAFLPFQSLQLLFLFCFTALVRNSSTFFFFWSFCPF